MEDFGGGFGDMPLLDVFDKKTLEITSKVQVNLYHLGFSTKNDNSNLYVIESMDLDKSN